MVMNKNNLIQRETLISIENIKENIDKKKEKN